METKQSTEGKWSHGKTMPVKNVQALAANAAELTEEAIKRYIRPARADDVAVAAHGDDSSQSIPVIDLGRLLDPQSYQLEAARLKSACNTYNLQVKNHGIPDTVLENMRNNLEHFFRLRLDEKNRFGRLPGDLQGYGQAFVESEHQTLDWCDRLYLVTQPPHDREMRPCPTTPVSFRESIESYSSELMRVAGSLMAIIARNLGVDLLRDTYVSQALRMTYYPACPMAHDKVLGISPHSDISMLTLVWELNMVGGLQIKRQDAWVPVKPHPKALVVNVGDFLEILTNGKYQSIEHRVTVNPRKERMSISAFHLPKFDMSVGPLSEIVGAELKKYKTLRVDEVAKVVFSIRLDGKKTKDYAMLSV
ncbi:2-oxoglutarate-dependent dioxygenase 11-like [Aegilops tauschii subsp. strangulata]|nr:2-oxoglutarate-dependent dioxygenase 11-like [Aegilops tauschii subsp. strangulata]